MDMLLKKQKESDELIEKLKAEFTERLLRIQKMQDAREVKKEDVNLPNFNKILTKLNQLFFTIPQKEGEYEIIDQKAESEIMTVLKNDYKISEETLSNFKDNFFRNKVKLSKEKAAIETEISTLKETIKEMRQCQNLDFGNFVNAIQNHECSECMRMQERKHFLHAPINHNFEIIEKSIFKTNIISKVLVDELHTCREMAEYFLIYSTFLSGRINAKSNIWYRHFLAKKFFKISGDQKGSNLHEHFYYTFINPTNNPKIISLPSYMSLSSSSQRKHFLSSFINFDQINKTQISLYKDSKIAKKAGSNICQMTLSAENYILSELNIKIYEITNEVGDLDYND